MNEKLREGLECLIRIEAEYKRLTELFPNNSRFRMSYNLVRKFLRKYKRNLNQKNL